jgi:hypothetical protein
VRNFCNALAAVCSFDWACTPLENTVMFWNVCGNGAEVVDAGLVDQLADLLKADSASPLLMSVATGTPGVVTFALA